MMFDLRRRICNLIFNYNDRKILKAGQGGKNPGVMYKNEETKIFFDQNKCPYCMEETKWQEGPTGGLNMNIKCSGCGKRLNMCQIPGAFSVEKID